MAGTVSSVMLAFIEGALSWSVQPKILGLLNLSSRAPWCTTTLSVACLTITTALFTQSTFSGSTSTKIMAEIQQHLG